MFNKIMKDGFPKLNYEYASELIKNFDLRREFMEWLSANIINKLPYLPVSVSLPVELILWPIRFKMKFISIPISYKERIGVSKLEPLKAAWWTVIRILRSRFKKIK